MLPRTMQRNYPVNMKGRLETAIVDHSFLFSISAIYLFPPKMGLSRADVQSGGADNVMGCRSSGSKQEKERDEWMSRKTLNRNRMSNMTQTWKKYGTERNAIWYTNSIKSIRAIITLLKAPIDSAHEAAYSLTICKTLIILKAQWNICELISWSSG
ncbi:hypothetical protein SFRURICE_001904, partial [Spodoptera frugiperda]